MRFAQVAVLLIQVLFIVLVFTIVFYKPKEIPEGAVLGENAEVAACTADINGDGVVDDFDYAEIKVNYLSTNKRSPQDINGDGVVDLSDFSIIAMNFYKSCKS